jgi:hypothetical protein
LINPVPAEPYSRRFLLNPRQYVELYLTRSAILRASCRTIHKTQAPRTRSAFHLRTPRNPDRRDARRQSRLLALDQACLCGALLIVQNGLRCGLVQCDLRAHFLDLRCLLFELGHESLSLLFEFSDCCLAFFDFAMLFHKLI